MMISNDSDFQKMLNTATNIAASKATVLISGESGTGKELLARHIHEKSSRHHKRLVALNCAAVPEGLLESELFGFERGAFTGAVNQKIGKIELAHQSTILLDEISEMPLSLQSKLLRVLQEEEIDRLGGKNPIKIDIRVIATTNKDLRLLVRDGKFREDLYYRLNVITLTIPALRNRPFDIPILSEHFLQVNAILNSKHVTSLTKGALQKLQNWNWPGNVRELENVIERAVLLSQSEEINEESIVIDNEVNMTSRNDMPVTTIAEMEKKLIFQALAKTNQNRTRAAEILGISIRTLRNKLNEYKLEGEVEING
jgi:transcriptional regulator with PAS, ATPase and Fis domain